MKLKIRRATINDIEGIVHLCDECFVEKTDLEYARKVFEKTKDDPNQIYLVGIVDDQIIAHLKVTVIPTIYQPMSTYSILNHVCVKPEYRRHNIATFMLDEANKVSKQMGCCKMELWSNNTRQAAHACYKKYGFIVNDAKFFSKDVI